MAQQFIDPDVTNGLQAADIINGNFTELYSNLLLPVKLKNVNANTQQVVAANSFVDSISLSGTAGNPTVRIGLTPNGNELMDDTVIGNSWPLVTKYYSQNGDTIYFTVSGGTVSIRLMIQPNYY